MLYSILIYESEARSETLSDDVHAKLLDRHHAFQATLKKDGKLNSVVRLMPTSTASTLKDATVIDGPFADTKEQFVGFYLIEADSLEEVIGLSKMLPNHASLEIRPVMYYEGGDINGGSPTIIRHP